ncbi:Multidrug resistance protein homolog 49 [Gryllus bimaculatus]|nr:Multidrug resistance protein homolog 49 [Gryllus bimaculatus]
MRRFSYPEYTDDPILLALESVVSSMLMLGFVYTCIATIKSITTEKEHQVKVLGIQSELFHKSVINVRTTNTAATVGGLAWFLTYMPYSLLQMEYEDMSLTEKLLASLSFNTAMGYGFRVMIMHEGTGTGQHWYNLFKPATQDDTLTLGYIFLMFIVDSLIYMLITLYVEAVFPGDYGVPKPWYFPFQVFNGNKVAVDNLNLNMYEGQITVLLGHNGAGKTTTMSMLTGVYTPTSGTATVNGYDVARDSLGLCPQHNVLFDELTVREHLYFFGKLKGLSGKELEDEIRKYLQLLQLEPKEHKQSRTLSGGMKRKLAAGVALCGKSKVSASNLLSSSA